MLFNLIDCNNYWYPWVSTISEIFLIQFVLIYLIYLFFNESNPYYNLLYLFFLIFINSLFLGLYQLEVFTAFLLLIECSVIFIALLILLYLNIKGLKNVIFKKNIFLNNFNFFILILVFYYNYFSLSDSTAIFDFYSNKVYDNYYEYLNNNINNDLFGLTIMYYIIDVPIFLTIGYILLIGSVLCVNLFKLNKNIRVDVYLDFFKLFNFFENYVYFNFFRKQNLFEQGDYKSSIKFFKKKAY